MVMQVEARNQEDSFFSIGSRNENSAFLDNVATADESMSSLARDTSNTCRNVSMDNTRDNTRHSVNTHNSILDFTKDEEDDEEDEEEATLNTSVLFDDLQMYSRDECDDDASPVPSAPPANDDQSVSLLNTFTDSFVDSFCPAELPSASCTAHPQSSCAPSIPSTSTLTCYPQQRMQTSMDVWNLLGCSSAPGTDERDSIWSIRTAQVLQRPRRPTRAPMKSRLRRIHKLRMERVTGASRHGVTITPKMERSRTANNDGRSDPLASQIGLGMDPIPFDDDENGYDSDPEVGMSSSAAPKATAATSQLDEYDNDVSEQDHLILRTVQQTLNSTWTLTWHPNPGNVAEFGIPAKPMTLNIWMERGTVVTSTGVVLEPSFMWRDAYQPELAKHKLNASTQTPWSMRLLNTCRISECPETIDRTKYPFARASHCLMLRTCNDQEFLLEASSKQERYQVCERWKLAVARFASLAVMEDIDAIAREYFHPTLSSQMLTVNEP